MESDSGISSIYLVNMYQACNFSGYWKSRGQAKNGRLFPLILIADHA